MKTHLDIAEVVGFVVTAPGLCVTTWVVVVGVDPCGVVVGVLVVVLLDGSAPSSEPNMSKTSKSPELAKILEES